YHNAIGGSFDISNPSAAEYAYGSFPDYPQPSPFWETNSGTLLTYARTDGVTDGSATIQGVRNYDSTTTQWTTPDEANGTIDDPASQSEYMWNGNNPYKYSDPTGFSPFQPSNMCADEGG